MVSSFGFQPKNRGSIPLGSTNTHITRVTTSMGIEYDNLERQINGCEVKWLRYSVVSRYGVGSNPITSALDKDNLERQINWGYGDNWLTRCFCKAEMGNRTPLAPLN